MKLWRMLERRWIDRKTGKGVREGREKKDRNEKHDRTATCSRERDGGVMELDKMAGGVWGWRRRKGQGRLGDIK